MMWFAHLSREDQLLVMMEFPEYILDMHPEGVAYYLEYRVLKDELFEMWRVYCNEDHLNRRYFWIVRILNRIEELRGFATSVWQKTS